MSKGIGRTKITAVTSSGAKSFRATVVRGGKPLQWTIIRIPFDVGKTWGKKGLVKVVVEVNGFRYRTSLFPAADGKHTLIVNKKMQGAAQIEAGVTATFTLTPDTAPREVDVPLVLKRVFRQERGLRRFFDSLNYSTRKDIVKWTTDPKSEEAQIRRAEQIAVRLLETMEAERELPPLIKLAMSRNPKAADGWQKMSAIQRRSQLMAIFYYRAPESRARRLEKVLEMAAEYAEKTVSRARPDRS